MSGFFGKMRRRPAALLLALAAVLPGPAAALSCLPPDPVRLYTAARDSEDAFRIVHGRIIVEEPILLPEPVDPPGDAEPAETDVRITGVSLSEGGFIHPFTAPVTLSLGCLGPWCAAPPRLDETVLMAVEIVEGGHRLSLGPCPSNALPTNAAGLERVVECHRWGRCAETR